MRPERISALRRWVQLLNAARPGDVPVILAGLPEADLVAVVEVSDAPVSITVCEYVLSRGSTPALIALARRAVRDGRASIPPQVKQRLLDAAAEHAAYADGSPLPPKLLSELAEVAGPEAVWALELDRAGTLEEMAPEVRASMAVGTSEPLSSEPLGSADSGSGVSDFAPAPPTTRGAATPGSTSPSLSPLRLRPHRQARSRLTWRGRQGHARVRRTASAPGASRASARRSPPERRWSHPARSC